MNRRTFLAAAAGLAGRAAAPPPTNVLFVLADQWRSTAFDHATDPVVKTPNLTGFAAESARFTSTYAANPVCTPNRSCILTGRYSHQHGMVHNDIMLPPKERTLAHVFDEAGYATHYIGKWHMDGAEQPGFVPPGWRRRGFRTFEGFNRGHYYPTGAQYFTNEGKLLHPDVYEPTYQTDLAIDFMRRNREHPFYCYLSWGPPHAPYKPPKNWDIYDPAKLEFRPNVPAKVRDDARYRKQVSGYYGSCSALDHEFGRLMAFLGETGLAANTLVVFTSDHGDMLGSHGCWAKSKPEDESLHVPLYMRLPGRIRPKQNVTVLASSIDLAPTILSTCGLRLKTALGRDLSAAVLGGPTPQVDFVYAEGAMRRRGKAGKKAAKPADPDDEGGLRGAKGDARLGGVAGGSEWRSYVTPSHKLVVRADGQPGALFHVEKDPYEFKNLLGERSSAALEKDLLEKMRAWAKDVQVTSKDSMFARFSFNRGTIIANPALPSPANTPVSQQLPAWNVGYGYTRVFGPSLVNEFRFAFTRPEVSKDATLPRNEIVPNALAPGVNSSMPTFSVTGFAQLGAQPTGYTNVPLSKSSTVWEFSDNGTKNLGAHILKFGFTHQFLKFYTFTTLNGRGAFTFDGSYTQNPQSRTGTGSAMADLLLGVTQQVQTSTLGISNLRAQNDYWYFQDDWKITQRLTLNLGIRYELYWPITDTDNKLGNFILDPSSPDYGHLVFAGLNGQSRSLMTVDKSNLAPRFGFAYRVPHSHDLTIRGGYGMFYGNPDEQTGVSVMMTNNPPFVGAGSVNLIGDRNLPSSAFNLGSSLPATQVISPQNFVLNPAATTTLISWPSYYKAPVVHQWNLSLLKELPAAMVLEVSYIGNSSYENWNSYTGNQPLTPGPGAVGSRRPYAQYTVAAVTMDTPWDHGNYEGMTARLESA